MLQTSSSTTSCQRPSAILLDKPHPALLHMAYVWYHPLALPRWSFRRPTLPYGIPMLQPSPTNGGGVSAHFPVLFQRWGLHSVRLLGPSPSGNSECMILMEHTPSRRCSGLSEVLDVLTHPPVCCQVKSLLWSSSSPERWEVWFGPQILASEMHAILTAILCVRQPMLPFDEAMCLAVSFGMILLSDNRSMEEPTMLRLRHWQDRCRSEMLWDEPECVALTIPLDFFRITTRESHPIVVRDKSHAAPPTRSNRHNVVLAPSKPLEDPHSREHRKVLSELYHRSSSTSHRRKKMFADPRLQDRQARNQLKLKVRAQERKQRLLTKFAAVVDGHPAPMGEQC